MRKAILGLDAIGWSPNFWVYLMLYVIGASLFFGLLHVYVNDKGDLEAASLISNAALPDSSYQIDVMSPSEKRNKFRKTTV